MASFLATLLRRKGPSDVEGRTVREPPTPLPLPQPSQPQPVLPPNPTPIRAPVKDDDPNDLTLARRQSSQVNLNRFFASAPVGLHAILKAPSRPDIEIPFAVTPASPSAQTPHPNPLSPFHAVQLSTGPSLPTTSDTPLSRPARERRRSMTVSEIAANMQNIDVSQAALIMMPTRLRQELGQDGPAQIPGGSPSNNSVDREASGHLPHLSKLVVQPAAAGGDPGSPISATAAPGFRDARNIDRKPSIIREAVKHQQRSLPLDSGPSPGQRSPGASMIASSNTHSTESMEPSVQGSPISRAAGLAPADRRGATGLVPTMQLQQQHLMMHNSAFVNGLPGGGGHSSRASMSYGGSSAQPLITCPPSPSLQPPVVAGTRAVVRQSDPGELFRSRAAMSLGVSLEAMLADASAGGAGFVIGSRRSMITNHNGAGAGAGAGAGEAPSSGQVDDEQLQFTVSAVVSGAGGLADVKLPSITIVAPATGGGRRTGASEMRDNMGGGGGKGGLTAADVAALAEAMNAAQNEAARLRASALRNIDGRTMRSFVDVDLGGGGSSRAAASPPQPNENGGGAPTTGGGSPGVPLVPRVPMVASARGAHRPPQMSLPTGSPGRSVRLSDSPRPGASGSSRFETPIRNKSSALQDVDSTDAGAPDAGVYVGPAAPARVYGADVPNARRRS